MSQTVMPEPSPLSPAAQAVAWAYDNTPEKETGNHRYHWLAAALRAAADQVMPEYETTPGGSKIWPSEPVPSIRAALLAIAAELEGAE